jgi:hypothetical protein
MMKSQRIRNVCAVSATAYAAEYKSDFCPSSAILELLRRTSFVALIAFSPEIFQPDHVTDVTLPTANVTIDILP